ncbi:hypothetical protein PG988_003913 [Apiospora saccharicola]
MEIEGTGSFVVAVAIVGCSCLSSQTPLALARNHTKAVVHIQSFRLGIRSCDAFLDDGSLGVESFALLDDGLGQHSDSHIALHQHALEPLRLGLEPFGFGLEILYLLRPRCLLLRQYALESLGFGLEALHPLCPRRLFLHHPLTRLRPCRFLLHHPLYRITA